MSKLSQLVGNLNERPMRTIDMPGREGEKVGLWCLTLDEEERARKRAFDFVQNVLKFSAIDLAYDEDRAIQDAIICEVLSVALRDSDRPIEPYVQNALEIKQRLNIDEILAMWRQYLVYVKERCLLKEAEDPEKELDELVQLVAQNFLIETRLSRLASTSLRDLVNIAVDRLVSLNGMKPGSSAGASPSDSAQP